MNNVIPHGYYCYESENAAIDLTGKVPVLRIRTCPFWTKTKNGAYCSHLDIDSEQYDSTLIWDQVKMCGENRD